MQQTIVKLFKCKTTSHLGQISNKSKALLLFLHVLLSLEWEREKGGVEERQLSESERIRTFAVHGGPNQ